MFDELVSWRRDRAGGAARHVTSSATPLQSQGYFRRRAEFEAEGLDDDSILEAMGEERMIESGRWEAGYADFY